MDVVFGETLINTSSFQTFEELKTASLVIDMTLQASMIDLIASEDL